VHPFKIISGRKSLPDSGIGGLPETQKCWIFAEHDIVSDIELIDIKGITHAYDRMVNGDVRYRFVIDIFSLKPQPF
jgi:uncharacterized zinc-type alcohol dehydrogenase-like protein